MTQQRITDDAGTDELQSKFEYEAVELYRLNEENHITTYSQPYRVAFFNYLINVDTLHFDTEELY